MKLKWYGHSCFALTYADGTAIVIDPFDDSVGYPLCDARADAVLCSHDHFDHNTSSPCGASHRSSRTAPPRAVGGVKIRGLDCFHDDAQGARRGRNIAFILEGDGLRVAHLGDLGHMPTPEMYEALRGVDILLIPIGGTYTITTPEAVEVIREVRPHTAIAMHFKNRAVQSAHHRRAGIRAPHRRAVSAGRTGNHSGNAEGSALCGGAAVPFRALT